MLTTETLEKDSEICSNLTIKTPERRQWRRTCVFIVNFDHTFFQYFFVYLEQESVRWECDVYILIMVELVVERLLSNCSHSGEDTFQFYVSFWFKYCKALI